jgi:hypothetical protein
MAEPPEMPSIEGSARGFRSRAWKTNPPRARVPPTKAARITLGRRICQIIVAVTESGSLLPVNIDMVSRKCVPDDPAEIATMLLNMRTIPSRSVVKIILKLMDIDNFDLFYLLILAILGAYKKTYNKLSVHFCLPKNEPKKGTPTVPVLRAFLRFSFLPGR